MRVQIKVQRQKESKIFRNLIKLHVSKFWTYCLINLNHKTNKSKKSIKWNETFQSYFKETEWSKFPCYKEFFLQEIPNDSHPLYDETLGRVVPYRIATGKNSEANNYSHFPDDSTAFIKSNLSASVRRNHVKVHGTSKREREREKRTRARRFRLKHPSSFLRLCKMRNFLPRRKVLNIQYSPQYEPSGTESSPVRKKRRLERQTVAGTRRNFIFPIFYRVPRFVEDGWYKFTESKIS